jgi:hypothetical protein
MSVRAPQARWSPQITLLAAVLFILCLTGVNKGTAVQSAGQNSPGGSVLWEFDAGG